MVRWFIELSIKFEAFMLPSWAYHCETSGQSKCFCMSDSFLFEACRDLGSRKVHQNRHFL